MSKLRIYHFHNGTGGGVLSVIRNLLQFSDNPKIENHIIHAINKREMPVYSLEHIEGAASERIFYYSPQWNFYYTCTQLAKFLPDEKSIIVAHDWIELGMVSNLGAQFKVVHMLHGDYNYYYDLAIRNKEGIDVFLCVAKSIRQKLGDLLPQRKDDIFYLRFPVGDSTCSGKKTNYFNIIFIGRCTKEKGYHLLPGIAMALAGEGIQAHWHIVGDLREEVKESCQWMDKIAVDFYGNIPNENVKALLCDMDILISPSIAEGMPLNIIEAMKAGVVPVVNDLEGGIQELIIHEQTGIKIANNDQGSFINAVKKIAVNNAYRQNMAANARQWVNELFEPATNATAIEQLFENVKNRTFKKKLPFKVYGSRLDEPWLPNWMVTAFRKLND